jgi:hypothetical protein
VGGYFIDVLLVLSLIGAPVIFCTLLYFGLKISHETDDRLNGGDRLPKPDTPAAPGQNTKDKPPSALAR